MSWSGEKQRHAMSAKGVKSKFDALHTNVKLTTKQERQQYIRTEYITTIDLINKILKNPHWIPKTNIISSSAWTGDTLRVESEVWKLVINELKNHPDKHNLKDIEINNITRTAYLESKNGKLLRLLKERNILLWDILGDRK